jgi:ABC-type glycerol-3-phosphate transport system substrate-binding protein
MCPWITAAPTLWSAVFGGQFYDPANDKWTIVQDPNVAMLDWHAKYAKLLGGPDKVTGFAKLFTGNNSSFYADGQFVFYAGKMAMEGMGEWEPHGWIPEFAPKLVDQVGEANPPTVSGVPYGTGQTDGGNVFLLPKGVANTDAAMEFLTWVAGPDPVYQWDVAGGGNIPPVKSVALGDKFLGQAPYLKPWIDLLQQNHMVPPATSPILSFFSDQLTNATQEVIYGKQSSKQALTTVANNVDGQMVQFKKSHPNW